MKTKEIQSNKYSNPIASCVFHLEEHHFSTPEMISELVSIYNLSNIDTISFNAAYMLNRITSLFEVIKKSNLQIIKISFSHTSIGYMGAKELAENLKVNSTITHINLKNNSIGAEGAAELAKLLKINTTITCINLSHNNLYDGGVEKLLEALKCNKTVSSIDLSFNSISGKGFGALSQALKDKNNISSLDLSYNNISDEVIKMLFESLESNKKLTSITLKDIDMNWGYLDKISEITDRNNLAEEVVSNTELAGDIQTGMIY